MRFSYAGMAELADALDSGSNEGSFVQVQVLLPAPFRVFITDLSYEHSNFLFSFLSRFPHTFFITHFLKYITRTMILSVFDRKIS